MSKSEKKIAVYPGSFDPVTNGHISLIERAIHLFDEVIVAIAKNVAKQPLFSDEERTKFMEDACAEFAKKKQVRIIQFEGLTADLVNEIHASAIIRGLRALSDFEYEFQMALMNRKLARDVETVFLMPSLSWVYLSSSLVKDVASNGGDISGLVPASVKRALQKKYNNK